ncbi:hypothetical protein JW933_00145 [candidate division FCPU426 bacterium]|nr:hypothetical protein [candidate division FCPU426 bacterium]
MRKAILVIAGLLLIAGSASAAAKNEELKPVTDENGFNVIEKSGFTFKWKIVEADLECEVSAPTEGWVAVGFNPEKPKMDKSNLIIGFVKDGELSIADHHAKGWRHVADKENNILKSSGEEKDGQTSLAFTIPMANDANGEDAALAAGQKIHLLLAQGNGDNFKKQHKKKTMLEITL